MQYRKGKEFGERRKKQGDLFEEYYIYYESGNLKHEACIFIKNGFFKGKGYLYDITGNLKEVIDYDAPYKYTWEDVLKFVKKHKIDLYDTYTIIDRDKNVKYGHYWDIAWKVPSTMNVYVVILSGEDGRILMQRIDTFKR